MQSIKQTFEWCHQNRRENTLTLPVNVIVLVAALAEIGNRLAGKSEYLLMTYKLNEFIFTIEAK